MVKWRCLYPVSHIVLNSFLPSFWPRRKLTSAFSLLLFNTSLHCSLPIIHPSSLRWYHLTTALESASDHAATYFLSSPSCQRTIFALWKGQLVQTNLEEKDPDAPGGTKVVGIQYELVSPLLDLSHLDRADRTRLE